MASQYPALHSVLVTLINTNTHARQCPRPQHGQTAVGRTPACTVDDEAEQLIECKHRK